jgi:hypothetical protein
MKILKYTLLVLLACCSQSVFAAQFLNLDAVKNSIPKSPIHQLRKYDGELKRNKDLLERELDLNHKVWEENKAAIVAYEAKEAGRLKEEAAAQEALYQEAQSAQITNPAMKNEGVVRVRHGRSMTSAE